MRPHRALVDVFDRVTEFSERRNPVAQMLREPDAETWSDLVLQIARHDSGAVERDHPEFGLADDQEPLVETLPAFAIESLAHTLELVMRDIESPCRAHDMPEHLVSREPHHVAPRLQTNREREVSVGPGRRSETEDSRLDDEGVVPALRSAGRTPILGSDSLQILAAVGAPDGGHSRRIGLAATPGASNRSRRRAPSDTF
jgi:hypothetical protein